jgi:CubicO group peptidase (beta-lactamase class C family)
MSGLLSRCWLLLIVFGLSAASQAQPPLGLPSADPASVGMSADGLAAIPAQLAPLIDEGKVPGFVTLVARKGKVVHFEAFGQRDVERGKPMTKDTIFRMYSMTKPITGVAIMILVDEGKLSVSDPVSKFIPEFAGSQVVTTGEDGTTKSLPAKTPMTIQHLLTHTSGLTYGTEPQVKAAYIANGVRTGPESGITIEEAAKRAAKVPLICEPGSAWHYGISIDVLGRIVEVVAEQPFDEFLHARIFKPLGMKDTGFAVPPGDVDRFAANYKRKRKAGMQLIDDPENSPYLKQPSLPSGGGGLVGTAADYLRFAQMLLNGGELDGVRILSKASVAEMTKQQLPPELGKNPLGGSMLPGASEGVGFGYAGAVVMEGYDRTPFGSAGTYTWGGAASTDFWIDFKQELIGMVLTQLMPTGAYPTRATMVQTTNAAIVE